MPSEQSAGEKGRREGKQAVMLSTLKPIWTLKAECKKQDSGPGDDLGIFLLLLKEHSQVLSPYNFRQNFKAN